MRLNNEPDSIKPSTLGFHFRRHHHRLIIIKRPLEGGGVTDLEPGASILNPSDDDVGVSELAVGRQGEDDVAQRCHAHFKGDVAGVAQRPQHLVIGVQLHRVLQVGAALVERRPRRPRRQRRSAHEAEQHQGAQHHSPNRETIKLDVIIQFDTFYVSVISSVQSEGR